jgi:hypothetical protein
LVAGHLRGDDGIVQAVKMTLPDGYPGQAETINFRTAEVLTDKPMVGEVISVKAVQDSLTGT